MNISSIAYQKFYEVLLDHFARKNISEKRYEKLGYGSYLIWEEKNPETGVPIFEEVFGLYLDDSKHFYKKKGQFDPAKVNFGFVNDSVLIRAFQEMNLSYPDQIDKKIPLTIGQKARVLYQVFLEKFYLEFWEENKAELEIYNRASGKLVKEKNNIQKSEKNDNSTNMVERQSFTDKDEQAITDLVTAFYENIGLAKLEDAWNFLAPAFQRRTWKDDFSTFSVGYTNTISIHHIHVFDITRHSSGMKCKLYYEDDVVTYTSIELGNIGKTRVADQDSFIEKIKRLSEAAASAGLEGFEKIELQKFFEPAFSEYVWYKCGMKPDRITELLPSQETLTIPRLYTISCMVIENQWFINAINPVKAHSIR